MKLSFFQIAAIAFIFSLNATASELLPFPDENRSFKQTGEQEVLLRFKNRVGNLDDCNSLQEVESGLMERIRRSMTSSDRNYYQERLDIVIDTKINLNCE